MTKAERQKAIDELKEICQDIGCSGLSPDMCQNMPHLCSVIAKIVRPHNNRCNEHADESVNLGHYRE